MMKKCFPFRRRTNRRVSFRAKSPSRGFSLVEIMVALVIGMIGILVIMQVARTSEAQKRVTVGSGDAQNNGALALYAMQRDIRPAGYGFNSLSVLGCPLKLNADAETSLITLAPITINPSVIPAGDADTDTLLIVYGGGLGSPDGDTVTLIPGGGGGEGEGWRLGVPSAAHYSVNDWVIAAPSPWPKEDCQLIMGKVTRVDKVDSGDSEAEALAIEVNSDIGAVDQGILFNLGNPVFPIKIIGYAVRGGNLTTCDYMRADCADTDNIDNNWPVIASGVVSLKLQYCRQESCPMATVTAWDQDTPEKDGSQQDFACDLSRLTAVRMALVARNGEWNRDPVTTDDADTAPPPVWAGSENNPIDLSAAYPDDIWKHYRYQVYETIVPFRNIPWMKAKICSTP